jgi:hypothetical protein
MSARNPTGVASTPLLQEADMKALVRLASTCSVLMILGIASSVSAGGQAVLINFDTNPFNTPIPNATDIRTDYSSWGVTFGRTVPNTCNGIDGVWASNECLLGSYYSPPNVVTLCGPLTCSDISEAAHGAVVANLIAPADGVCIDVQPVSAEGYAVLRAYDGGNNLIATSFSSHGIPMTLCVSVPGIRRVEFSGAGSEFVILDNLLIRFDAVPTLPTTFSAIKAMYR